MPAWWRTAAILGIFAMSCARRPGAPQRAAAPTTTPALPGGAGAVPMNEPEPSRGGTSTGTAPQPQPVGGTVTGGETEGDPRSGSSNPFDEHGNGLANAADLECHTDDDCVCGIDRGTGACAIGPSSRVDTARQCPDFCHGIDGQQRIVCQSGRCAQTR